MRGRMGGFLGNCGDASTRMLAALGGLEIDSQKDKAAMRTSVCVYVCLSWTAALTFYGPPLLLRLGRRGGIINCAPSRMSRLYLY